MYPRAVRSTLVRAKLEHEGDMVRDEPKRTERREELLSRFLVACRSFGWSYSRFDAFPGRFSTVRVDDHGAVNEKVKDAK